jgi:CRISPR/Cas system-associated protein endoribonuclease Cas2
MRIFAPQLLSQHFTKKLRSFYQQYRQYILTDGLMYLVFIVFIGLLFAFFS